MAFRNLAESGAPIKKILQIYSKYIVNPQAGHSLGVYCYIAEGFLIWCLTEIGQRV